MEATPFLTIIRGLTARPVSVKILISYDGGITYSTVVNSTLNDGTEIITVPTLSANINTCRIKIESKGNIFYDVSNNNFQIVSDLGVHQISKNNPIGLSVWPNPFTNQINFAANNLNSESLTEVKIIDVLGKTIVQFNYNHKSELNETLDLSKLSSGMYFINISNNSKQSVYRIIKN